MLASEKARVRVGMLTKKGGTPRQETKRRQGRKQGEREGKRVVKLELRKGRFQFVKKKGRIESVQKMECVFKKGWASVVIGRKGDKL